MSFRGHHRSPSYRSTNPVAPARSTIVGNCRTPAIAVTNRVNPPRHQIVVRPLVFYWSSCARLRSISNFPSLPVTTFCRMIGAVSVARSAHQCRRRGFNFPPHWLGAFRCSRGLIETHMEDCMKYVLIIAAVFGLTAATPVATEDDCCGGGSCCPGACCMMMTE